MMRFVGRYILNDRGTSAAEFAMVIVPFIAIVLTIIGASFVFYTNMALQNATEAAARCWEIQAPTCISNADAIAYAHSHYYGLVPATFTTPSSNCGHDVTGTATFPLDVGIARMSIPLQANACFP